MSVAIERYLIFETDASLKKNAQTSGFSPQSRTNVQLAVTDNPVEALLAQFEALLLFVSIRVKVVNSVQSLLLRDEQHRLIAPRWRRRRVATLCRSLTRSIRFKDKKV